MTEFLRKKNNFENIEIEKLEKLMIYEYFSNLTSNVIKILKENPIRKINFDNNNSIEYINLNIENVYKQIIKTSRELKSEMKNRFINRRNLTYIYQNSINFISENLSIF